MNDFNTEEVKNLISQSINAIEDVINNNKYKFIEIKDKKEILKSNIDFIDQWKIRFADLSLDWTAADAAKVNAEVYIESITEEPVAEPIA